MITYSETSPYYKTTLKKDYLDILTLRTLSKKSDDIEYEIDAKYEYRPDLLAYDLYGDSRLWWVFSVRNKDVIKDPVYDMIPGQRIFLPKLSTIKAELGV